MTHKNFSLVAGVLFVVIALLHLLRLILGWETAIGGWSVPMWLSVVALIVAGYLGYQGLKLGK